MAIPNKKSKTPITEETVESKFEEVVEAWMYLGLLEEMMSEESPRVKTADVEMQEKFQAELSAVCQDVSNELESPSWRGYEGRRWKHVVFSKVCHLQKVMRGLTYLYEDVLRSNEGPHFSKRVA